MRYYGLPAIYCLRCTCGGDRFVGVIARRFCCQVAATYRTCNPLSLDLLRLSHCSLESPRVAFDDYLEFELHMLRIHKV